MRKERLFNRTRDMSVLISSYQCARLLQTTKEHVRKLLDSGEIDYFRDEEQVFRIRLESVLECASRLSITIDNEYYANLISQKGGRAEALVQSEQSQVAGEESFPSGKGLWRVGWAIAQRFKNRVFLNALYRDERLADMMFRYFSGETLEQIGGAYDLSRERARQLCEKGLNRLMAKLSYFTKDVVEMEVDKEAKPEEGKEPGKPVDDPYDLAGMGFSKRAMTVFRKQGIYSVEQLTKLSRLDLYRLPNLGRKTVAEIVKVLGKYGLAPNCSKDPKTI